LQSALGLSQLSKLDNFVAKRLALATQYDKATWNSSIEKPWQLPETFSSYHLYIIQISNVNSEITQQKVYQGLIKAGIHANLHYIPVYRHPFYAAMGFTKGYCQHAEDFYSRAISIPLYADLSASDQNYVVLTLKKLTGQINNKKVINKPVSNNVFTTATKYPHGNSIGIAT